MTLTATERQFLHIAKAAVSGGVLPAENMDWPAVFTLAGQQKLLPIVFEAARKTPAAAENAALFAAVKQQVIAQVLHQTMRASEFAGLYQRLRAAGLHPVVVKGQLCSRLYPQTDHRISTDDDLLIPDGEIDGLLAMPPHEHLLYLLLHAYKHFVRSGIGLRQFCDIGLWARAYHAEIDWRRLHEQCESVHAATFAAAAFRIARDYLGIEFDLPAPWDGSIDVEPLLHDSLCGGVYGSNDLTRLHSSTVTLNAVKASRTGEKSSVLRTVFPKREYLERRYPYLKKRPYLLPVAWVQRLAHYAGEKKTGADSSASGSIKLAKERIELMKRYDIMD